MISTAQLRLFAVVLSAIFALAAASVYETLTKKAESQLRSFNQLSRWKAEYNELLPFQTKWNTQLASAAQVNDVYSLVQILGFSRYGLHVDSESIIVTKVLALNSASGTSLNADSVCLSTAGKAGIVITADNIYPALISGIHQLAARKDISITSVAISTKGDSVTATVPLCLHLRR